MRYGRNRPDLILLDVMLPVIDGAKKARMLKEKELTRGIPILLISSKPEDELRRLVTESGADGYIRKPFSERQVLERVNGMIRRKAA